jgi:hypothetical protein
MREHSQIENLGVLESERTRIVTLCLHFPTCLLNSDVPARFCLTEVRWVVVRGAVQADGRQERDEFLSRALIHTEAL